jgi:hypothetical protein
MRNRAGIIQWFPTGTDEVAFSGVTTNESRMVWGLGYGKNRPGNIPASPSKSFGYKLQYVLHVPNHPRTCFSMGTAVHTVIALLSKDQLEKVTPTKERALELLNSCWSSDAYVSRTHELGDRIKAEAMPDTYLTWQAANSNRIVAA